MGRVLTNRTALSVAIESTLGVLPAAPVWFSLEPNGYSAYGATITTTPRNPISADRQQRKGTTTDLDSTVEWEGDLTKEHFDRFIESFVFASTKNPTGGSASQQPKVRSGATPFGQNLAAALDPPPAGTDPGFTHDALPAAMVDGALIFTRGFTNAVQNGLNEVLTGSTTTATLVKGTPTFVDETPGNTANATMEVAGVRSATGDIDVDANGDLTSTTLDFTTLGLTTGQILHVGGTGAAADNFTNAANLGYARVTSIAANLLKLDKKTQAFVTEANTTQTVVLLFGQFIRNVKVTDSDFLEQSFQFELTLDNAQVPGPGNEYEYAKGNLCNTIGLSMPLTDKSTLSLGFVGTDTEKPVTTQKTNASTPVDAVQTEAMNTVADLLRLRLQKTDETSIGTDFKSATLTLNNQVTPEKVLGNLGAKFLNTGNFLVQLEASVLFTDTRITAAIRDNETLTMDFILKSDDGSIAVDIPSLTLGGGDKEFPVNESVTINTASEAFKDATFATSIGVSIFPTAP